MEVTEVRQGTAVGHVDRFQDADDPVGVGGVSAMVFHDDIDIVFFGEGGELGEAVGDFFGGFRRRALAEGVNPYAVAAEEFGGFDPDFVIFDCFQALFFGVGSEVTQSVTHNENAFDSVVIAAFFQFFKVSLFPDFVCEELIDVFDGIDAVCLFRVFGESEVIEGVGSQFSV